MIFCDEQRQRVSESRAMRKIFGVKWEDVTEVWRNCINDKLLDWTIRQI
jgi:hypothetical protein